MGMIRQRGNKYWIKYYRNGKAYEESVDKALGWHASREDAKILLKRREGALSAVEFANRDRILKNALRYPEVPPPIIMPTSGGSGFPKEPGVYFLWEKNEIIYVGIAKNLHRRLRLSAHHILKPIMMISFLVFPLEQIQFAESYYIGLLKPKENFGNTAYHRGSARIKDCGQQKEVTSWA